MASTSTPSLSPSSTPSFNEHLSYPCDLDPEPASEQQPQQPRQILKDRLYIGNLHPTVDEYSLLQVFSKFGKVAKLDFLFHKTGLLKGKPRGYAFIEYGSKDDAMKALTLAHDKLLRGRKLVVTFAHQAPLDQYGNGVASGSKHKKSMMETGRPTTLSMLKTGLATRHEGKTQDKIAMMEAKLRQMESTNPKPASTPNADEETNVPERASASTLPYHSSLPVKPPPSLPNPLPKPPRAKIKHDLPALPMLPQQQQVRSLSDSIRTSSPSPLSVSISQQQLPRPIKSTKLAGVKIKPKEKEKSILP